MRVVLELGLQGSKDFNRQKVEQEGLCERSTITDVNRQFGWSPGYIQCSNSREARRLDWETHGQNDHLLLFLC